jgi:hypothetical protein
VAVHRHLLEAADSYRRDSESENRLTEVLAEVLRTAPELMAWLAAQAFRVHPDDAQSWTAHGDYVVETQFSFPTGERPDMKIRFTGSSLPPAEVVFCENKIGAGFTEWQKRGYPSAQNVIALTPDGRAPISDAARFVPIKWNQVARAAYGIGRTWGGARWRGCALSANAPSQYRMLAELIHYLEGEDVDVNVPGPLTETDLEIVPDVAATVDRWNTLFQLVADELKKNPGIEEAAKRWDTDHFPRADTPLTGWSVTLEGEGAWPALERTYAGLWWRELIMAPQPTWKPASEPIPAVGVGVSLNIPSGWPDELNENKPLRAAIQATNEFTLGMTWKGTVGRIFATLPLRTVASAETLDLQAEQIAAWARERLDAIIRIGSGQ